MQKIKYITNRELLAEIHTSKNTYCSFLAPEFANFDVIVASLDDVTPELIQQVAVAKALKLSSKTITIDPASLDREEIVFRLMSDTHLPSEADEKRRKVSSTGGWVVKTNFPPFQHFIFRDGLPIEVGRSHWHGGLVNGKFTLEYGGMSNRLASMFILLVERYSRGGSWRSYSYNDEMRSHALVQLSQVGLQFNEARSDNPFSFFTQIIKNCLHGDTMILTREFGSIAIKDVSEQDVTLLDGNGDWVKSHIYDYGVQETVNLNFSGNSQEVSIRSTLDHGWVQEGTGERIDTRHFVENDGHNTKNVRIADLCPNQNGREGWRVDPASQNYEPKLERVYCPDVQTTHTFVLSSGIHTFQCFRRILNLERRAQDIRDDLLMMSGAMPSYTRQVDNEMEQRDEFADTPTKAKRGRKPKTVQID